MTTKDHESDINDFITLSENRAWAILTSFDGNGWVVPVTLSVSIGANQEEAITKVLAALEALGIEARRAL